MKIFVTGATGTTGTETVRALQKSGANIRLGVRNLEKARTLAGPNTELVPFDWDRPDTWNEALRGTDRLYLCTNMDDRAHDRAIALIDTAVATGVNHVVKLSAMGADSVPGITIARWHRTVERYLQASGVAWTFLRPAAYMSNFGLYWGATVKQQNKIFLPLGNGKVSFIDPRDIGAAAAVTLTTPGHVGRVYTLTGGEAIDVNQVARELSQVTGRTIDYVDVPENGARDAMKGANLPEWMIEGMMGLYGIFKAGWGSGVTNDVRQLTGRAPFTFAQFAKDYVHFFK